MANDQSQNKKPKHLPKQTKVYVGAKIEQFTVIKSIPTPTTETKRWRVECSCGTRITIRQNYLTRENPKQDCGGPAHQSERMKFKREYGIWTMMHFRCYNSTHVSYKEYGGRGIKVNPEWHDVYSSPTVKTAETRTYDGFSRFLADMGPAPTPTHSLDRIDPDSNYGAGEPGNPLCRWATPKEQANNKRSDKIKRLRAEQAAAAKMAADEQARLNTKPGTIILRRS